MGCYYCPAPHKRDDNAPAHAWINENKLCAFLEELLRENPRLIESVLSAGGDRAVRSAARRTFRCTLLEERLQQARLEYADKEKAAQAKAAEVAEAAGIMPLFDIDATFACYAKH